MQITPPPEFTSTAIFQRRALLLAQLLYDHWEEKSGFDTRFFHMPLIRNEWVLRGRSIKGEGYGEHIVPRVLIRDECLKMYDRGESLMAVRDAIVAHLGIVMISREEAHHLDHVRGWKTTMPPGWRFGVDDPMARITDAGIILAVA
ncbi:hypothetical protein [Massilia aerilata]|uniref:Uncharacterized protein n=1 Tax=Massilia aerilata TaxID=453817 RepID=A0ABW0RR16_9BURK